MAYRSWKRVICATCGIVACFLDTGSGRAQDGIRLREQFPLGYLYHVSTRVDLTGTLTLPLEKGQTAARSLEIRGNSAIEYDERVLGLAGGGQVQKTARIYRRMEFNRKAGTQLEQNTLRPQIRRLILLRHEHKEVPFSPDGALLWSEIDQVRTDVFTPDLQGLLPNWPVRRGERWTADKAAVLELTDLERIDEGSLTCELKEFTTVADRRHARVSFSGTVRGPGEDGMTRQQLDGYLFFDLESSHLSYLSLRGVQFLLDKEGGTVGRVEGNFVLTRRPVARSDELSDLALRGVALEPNEENTLLQYENADLGVRFLYPRRWRVQGVRGRQVAVDENHGSGLLLTVEPSAQTPSGEQFLQESRAWLQKDKATVLRVEPVRQMQKGPPTVETFAIEAEANRQRFRMEYFVVRHPSAGVVVAARLQSPDVAHLQRDVQRMVQSIQMTK